MSLSLSLPILLSISALTPGSCELFLPWSCAGPPKVDSNHEHLSRTTVSNDWVPSNWASHDSKRWPLTLATSYTVGELTSNIIHSRRISLNWAVNFFVRKSSCSILAIEPSLGDKTEEKSCYVRVMSTCSIIVAAHNEMRSYIHLHYNIVCAYYPIWLGLV